jgi:amino acid adenylation domain-containing protein
VTDPGASDDCLWLPVRSVTGRYSAWPADRPVPVGWQTIGLDTDRDSAFAVVAAQWTTGTSATPVSAADTADGRFFAVAAQQPHQTAVIQEGASYSYAELAELILTIRSGLWRLGLRPGEATGVCMGRSVEMIAVLIAVLGCGAAYVPMSESYPAARLECMASDVDVRCVVADASYHDRLAVLSCPVVTAQELCTAPRQHVPSSLSRPDGLAYVIYTSGSTGTPKGVEVENANLTRFLDATSQLLPATASNRVLFSTPLSFDIAGLEIFWPLVRGGCCLIAPSTWLLSTRTMAGLINTGNPSLVQATPTGWRLLLDAGARPGDDAVLLCGGEALPPTLAKRIAELPALSYNVYGPTEATIWATAARIEDGPVSIGTAMTHARTYVLDEQLRAVPEGTEGELYIGGPAVARGYRNRPRLTAERFLPDPAASPPGQPMYASGDIVRSVRGKLYWLRRRDMQVKIKGHRIELGEIETVAMSADGVAAAAAVVRPDESGSSSVWLYLESDQPAAGSGARQLLRERLPAAIMPARIIVLSSLPVTANGKIDRVALSKTSAPA